MAEAVARQNNGTEDGEKGPAPKPKRRRWLRVGLCLLLILLGWLFGYPFVDGFFVETETQWLQRNFQKLVAENVTPDRLSNARPFSSLNQHASEGLCRVTFPGNGIVVLPDRSWVLIAAHSVHQRSSPHDDRLPQVFGLKPIRDLILARTSEGDYLVCRGHVCGGIKAESEKPIQCLEDFRNSSVWRHRWEVYPPAGSAKN